jgi:uncharacterized protein (TIGR00369 family)
MSGFAMLAALPYARFLGLTVEASDAGLIVTMPFAEELIGNPFLPALHGGSTAALLELTAMAQVAHTYPALHLPRPINVTVTYLRPGKPVDTRARARISKAGRRVAHIQGEAWQDDADSPVAALSAHFLIGG